MIIGITGGIASGKSTVTAMLETWHYHVVDADKLVLQAYQQDNIKSKILAYFNTLDKAMIASRIFNSKEDKAMLETFIHPYVIEQIKAIIKVNKEPFLFLDIPLLYEAKLAYLCDQVWVVYVDEATQIKRLIARDTLDHATALKRIHAQMKLSDKAALATVVLDNTKDEAFLLNQLQKIIKQLEK